MQTNKTIHHFKHQVQKGVSWSLYIKRKHVHSGQFIIQLKLLQRTRCALCVYVWVACLFLYFFVHVFIYIDVFLFCLFYFVYAHSDVAFYLLGAKDTDTRLLLFIYSFYLYNYLYLAGMKAIICIEMILFRFSISPQPTHKKMVKINNNIIKYILLILVLIKLV